MKQKEHYKDKVQVNLFPSEIIKEFLADDTLEEILDLVDKNPSIKNRKRIEDYLVTLIMCGSVSRTGELMNLTIEEAKCFATSKHQELQNPMYIYGVETHKTYYRGKANFILNEVQHKILQYYVRVFREENSNCTTKSVKMQIIQEMSFDTITPPEMYCDGNLRFSIDFFYCFGNLKVSQ